MYQATTPFGQRSVTAGLVKQAQRAQTTPAMNHINKWEIFRELTVAKDDFGVTDRDLTVLNALLTFHRETNLSDNDMLIVFPSNAALGERAHGMAESTLRRHLAALVRAGLIQRNDSPNGKRFALTDADGVRTAAYGFDLRPLLISAPDIAQRAATRRQIAAATKQKRIEVSVMLRDAAKLCDYALDQGIDVPDLIVMAIADHRRALRRKIGVEELARLRGSVRVTLGSIKAIVSLKSEKMSGNDVQNDCHHHNSNTDTLDSEPCLEPSNGADPIDPPAPDGTSHRTEPNIPLSLVIKACPDVQTFTQSTVSSWYDLVKAADIVRPMIGISPSAWQNAVTAMGAETAAITVAYIVQRAADIRNPGGYLRSLTSKAEARAFSAGPLVMSLLTPAGQC